MSFFWIKELVHVYWLLYTIFLTVLWGTNCDPRASCLSTIFGKLDDQFYYKINSTTSYDKCDTCIDSVQ